MTAAGGFTCSRLYYLNGLQIRVSKYNETSPLGTVVSFLEHENTLTLDTGDVVTLNKKQPRRIENVYLFDSVLEGVCGEEYYYSPLFWYVDTKELDQECCRIYSGLLLFADPEIDNRVYTPIFNPNVTDASTLVEWDVEQGKIVHPNNYIKVFLRIPKAGNSSACLPEAWYENLGTSLVLRFAGFTSDTKTLCITAECRQNKKKEDGTAYPQKMTLFRVLCISIEQWRCDAGNIHFWIDRILDDMPPVIAADFYTTEVIKREIQTLEDDGASILRKHDGIPTLDIRYRSFTLGS